MRIPYACIALLASLVALGEPCRGDDAAYPTVGKIERLDPRLDAILPAEATIEKLAEGYDWSEGPVWDRNAGRLLFSDVPRNCVLQWKPGAGASVYLKPSGYTGSDPRGEELGSNGLAIDSRGRLILCQHGDRRVARMEDDGTWTTLAGSYRGKPFNSPNDLAIQSNGDIYFTDPPYGLPRGKVDDPANLGFFGVYRIAADGQVTLLTDKLTRPNGLAFSPDEKRLYVAQSDPKKAVWFAFDVAADGTLGPSRVFFDATPWVEAGMKGLPDGLKVDVHGNLFATGPGGVNIFAPDGTHLGRIHTGQATANCAFGGDDGSTLFITADMMLCRVRTTTRGAGQPKP